MDQGNFTIDWKEFREASPRRFKDLVTREDFSDVTLVSGDGHRLPAHQVILATGCFFFKNLLEGETTSSSANQRPLIFLRGVAGGLLEPLLQFLYTGSAQISEILIADFLALAEDLGIDGLANSSGKDIFNEVPVLAEETEARKPKIEKTEDLDKDSSGGGMLNMKAEEDLLTRNGVERKHNNRALKVCHTCNKTFNDASNFRRHIKKCPFGLPRASTDVIKIPKRSADGFYHCQYCGKEVRDSSNIRRHIRNRHTVQMGQATST